MADSCFMNRGCGMNRSSVVWRLFSMVSGLLKIQKSERKWNRGKNMDKEEQLFRKRLLDLAEQSYRNCQYTHTAFLTQGEQEIYYQMLGELGNVESMLFGGVEGCERQVLRFGGTESLGYEMEFPICCIEVRPALEKFSDKLGHRDYLGALMNLGITRNSIGDIMQREKCAYLFCLDKVADYILENLTQIKHTSVKCKKRKEMPEAVMPQKEAVNLVVTSMRIDVIIAKLYHLSRSQSLNLFREKKIFVNGRQVENNSGVLKEQDTVSVRGYGKFICEGCSHMTKKGNLNIRVSRYV